MERVDSKKSAIEVIVIKLGVLICASLAVFTVVAYAEDVRGYQAELSATAIAEELPGSSFADWKVAVGELTALGEPATPTLSRLIRHEDRAIRTAAAHALAGIQGFESPEDRLRATAALLGHSLRTVEISG